MTITSTDLAYPAAAAPGATEDAAFLAAIWAALGGDEASLAHASFAAEGALPSVFAVSGLAAASVAAAGLAASELIAARHGGAPAVRVDRRLASFWFSTSIRPQGWKPAPQWDAIAGDYATADGWIRLHTNAPHHRAAALRVLDVPLDKERVASAVSQWKADALEAAVLAEGGCAGAMRSLDAWAAHAQGRAVMAEPLLHVATTGQGPKPGWALRRERPLAGVRVLDMTRVLAGPVATRLLAGWGADVLRIDPPTWDEPAVVPEVTLGKRCARLDLRSSDDRATFEQLLRGADVLVHGLRPGALEGLGLGSEERQRLRPGLVDVRLDAYGFTGPWSGRRGFDSIVQMSTGIADAAMRRLGRDRPTPLPAQALDHATGYLMAAAVLRGLQRRVQTGEGSETRASLARTAALLTSHGVNDPVPGFAAEGPDDLAPETEHTVWGPARRLSPPLQLAGALLHWALPAGPLGTSNASKGWLPIN
jgi:crotonobetainyl-CoA:carnitine CoA-transferase CaiB-like acyl-CoA transferase